MLLINQLIPSLGFLGIICLISFAQGQDYLFTTPVSSQFVSYQQDPNQFPPSDIIPFRQTPTGFQSPDTPSEYFTRGFSHDLQTSDLALHLQQTLPQYRFTTDEPFTETDAPYDHQSHRSVNRAMNTPVGFRSSAAIKPTTLRPNYSHLFARNQQNRNPSQTETFLGQITLQNPIQSHPELGNVKSEGNFPEKSQEITSNSFSGQQDDSVKINQKPNKLSSHTNDRPDFLNHRSRFFPSDVSQKVIRSQVNDHLVNNGNEVLITTKSPANLKATNLTHVPDPTSKSAEDLLSFNLKFHKRGLQPKASPTTLPLKSLDLEPLLEEPLKDGFGQNGDDGVEVIKSNDEETTLPVTTAIPSVQSAPAGPSLTTVPNNIELNTLQEDGNTENPEYNYSEELYDENVDSDNHIQNEYSDATSESDNSKPQMREIGELKKDKNAETPNESTPTYDVITMKPTKEIREYDFYDFVDSSEADSREAPSVIDTTAVPMTVSISSSIAVKKGNQIIDSNEEKMEPEVVVSVVTSKTVVNNTIIAPMTPVPIATKELTSTTDSSIFANSDNTTDTWVVVASVQTSRSISGARYLPSSIVEQEERVKLLNEHSNEDENSSKEDYYGSNEYYQDTSEEITGNTSDTSNEKNETAADTTTVFSTSTKSRTSTESLIDKLDRVQSDLSSSLLTGGLGNNIALINENMTVDMTTMMDMDATTSTTTTTTKAPYLQVNIRKFSPANRPSSTRRPKPGDRSDFKPKYADRKRKISATEPQKNTSLLPPGYKITGSTEKNSKLLEEILSKVRPVDETKLRDVSKSTIKEVDISKLLPPGYKLDTSTLNTKSDDISKVLLQGIDETSTQKTITESSIFKNTKVDDISKFLPPGYKYPKYENKDDSQNTKATQSSEKTTESSGIFKHTKLDDISKFLPSGYKLPKSTTESSLSKNTKADDISKFLPPGYKLRPSTFDKPKQFDLVGSQTESDNVNASITQQASNNNNTYKNVVPGSVDITALLPPDYKLKSGSTNTNPVSESSSTTTKPSGGFKVIFPSRPGGGTRKSASRTTPRSNNDEPMKVTAPTILKGWPSRATTEFTGWPTPSTTPISIEKLLEAARTASTSTTQTIETTVSTTSTTTTTTTTTTRPTTPGVCVNECDLAGTIKLVGGAKWVPELLDRNTREWQILANEVQAQLNDVYSSSPLLSKWYKKIRIDGFSEGSVLVDYLVELNDLGRSIDTYEVKKLFHDSLDSTLTKMSSREGKSLNDSTKLEGKLTFGNFIVDPKFTDFIVLPKQSYPTPGYADDNVLLPQWAIAVIVIGLASLLFVIIFGVTVLVNRQKNSKKKNPTPLTEDMLNELNKNHMGGFDNYGAEDLYNMEDVWNDREYDQKNSKKKSSGSIHGNSMSNLYDSWRSEWNGYYYNGYYGNNQGSSQNGYGRRRSDYDTNF